MKKIIIVLFILFGISNISFASHYMGGEITWECIPQGQVNQGKFIFTMKVYRECAGILFGSTQTINSNSPAGNFTVTEITGWPKDISPDCNNNPNFPHITCAGATASNTGAIEEHIYRSQPIQISGVPPASGWMFYWGSCCRNPATNIINANTKSWRLRAIMYPYGILNTYPCYDNSPTFAEVPRTVICTGYPFTYNHNAFDVELDSLYFEWGQPLLSNGNPLNTYTASYSYFSPLPGTTQNPNNVPASVNSTTGTISFTSYTTGAYVTSTKVSAYKCGIKVAEIWRDMQVVLLSCGTNAPPNVTPPFNNGTSFLDSVYAGDNICFNLSATDFQFLPNGTPQTMTIEASGLQLGSFIPPVGTNPPTLSSTSGCYNPPCATLTPAPGPNYPLTGIFGVQTQFCWQTECQHIANNTGCGVISNLYTFVLKVSDDFCPAPAINISTITIKVLAKPILESSDINCLKVYSNDDVELNWSVPIDTLNTFYSYYIYSSPTFAGPYVKIDSIFDINQTTYIHHNTLANTQSVYYYVNTASGCDSSTIKEEPADTFQTIFVNTLNTGNSAALITWNPTCNPLLNSSTGIYKVYREYPLNNWNLVGTTTNLTYVDSISICGDSVNYYVEISDTILLDSNQIAHTCQSLSNINGDYFFDTIPPNKPIIDSVSINGNNYVLSWDKNTPDTDRYIIYLLVNGVYTPIDTVTDTTYINTLPNLCDQKNTFAVAALDSCDNISLISDPHNTILISYYKSTCDNNIKLSWNDYINYEDSLSHYEIYVNENGNGNVLIGTTNNNYLLHDSLTDSSTYCYTIKAISNNGYSSSSCIVCVLNINPKIPQYTYIRYTSVLNDNDIELKILTDTSAAIKNYNLYRSNDNINWKNIDNIPPNYTNPNLLYNDNINTSSHAYYYKVDAIDSCDNIHLSNITRSVFLTGNPEKLINKLSWNKYLGYDGGIDNYVVYRSIDGVWETLPISMTNNTYLNDNVSNLTYTNGLFSYYVVAVENINSFSFKEKSKSNIITIQQKPKLMIPSAFNPGSDIEKNKTIYPQGIFLNSKDYEFTIFNRWGEKLFTTHEINVGWDGTYNGIKSPQDVYTYYVRFSIKGQVYEYNGTVTLIR